MTTCLAEAEDETRDKEAVGRVEAIGKNQIPGAPQAPAPQAPAPQAPAPQVPAPQAPRVSGLAGGEDISMVKTITGWNSPLTSMTTLKRKDH